MRIRFNLGRGENYMKWKIEYKDSKGRKHHFHLEPNLILTLIEPKLLNRRETANKIHEGANKRPCAWIQCKDILVGGIDETGKELIKIGYNPKKKPFWTTEQGDINLDGREYKQILIKNKEIYVVF